MNTGLLTGTKPGMWIPPWVGGGDPLKDGAPVIVDSKAPGGVSLGGQFPAHWMSAYRSVNQTIGTAAWTTVAVDTVYSASPTTALTMINGVIFTPPGKYLVSCWVYWNTLSNACELYVGVGQANALVRVFTSAYKSTMTLMGGTTLLTATPTASFVQIMVYQSGAATNSVLGGYCWLDVQRVQ